MGDDGRNAAGEELAAPKLDCVDDTARYLEDIRDIKKLLTANEEKPIVSPWAFYSWGLLILIGTGAHAAARSLLGLDYYSGLLLVWAPAVLIGAVLEGLAYFQVYRRRALVISNPRVMKTYLGLWGLFVSGSVITIRLLALGAMEPGLILVMLALFFMVYALASYHRILGPAYGLLGLGIIFMALRLGGASSYVAAGLASSLAFLAGGLLSRPVKRER